MEHQVDTEEVNLLRPNIDATLLKLPNCPIPRPDDEIVWYSDARIVSGTLLGHTPYGKPIVRSEFGNMTTLPSFDYIRLKDFTEKRGPNWLYLDAVSKVQSPLEVEKREFDRILHQRTQPGPQYIQLISEIWNRGYEIFLVGGTVRDVIAGVSTNDVDLVTTMPLTRAIALLTSMYRYKPSMSRKNGYVRLGGKLDSGDPFIDLKMFSHHEPGTANACFGSRFDFDVHHRDFACNSIYYDPINEVLIDPSGLGIEHAEGKHLSIVCQITKRAPFHLAQITIRFFKFLNRGFSASPSTIEKIQQDFIPNLSAMAASTRVTYVQRQVLSKYPQDSHESLLNGFREQMVQFASEAWFNYFEPITMEILK